MVADRSAFLAELYTAEVEFPLTVPGMVFTIAAHVTSKRIITGILYGNSASTGRCRVGFAVGCPAHAAGR